jgi:murein DD-endopeptidase MepM/ murein hydrolase activator NlpD
MAANRFKYNPATCRYEPHRIRGPLWWKKFAVFMLLSFLLALAGFFITVKHFQTLHELTLDDQNNRLRISWNIMHKRILIAREKLAGLVEKDDKNYRVILDTEPLAPPIREAGFGGSEKFDVRSISQYPYILNDFRSIEKLQRQAEVELQSYAELEEILDQKMLSWAARPAIQPISNGDLKRLHLTFGLRPHPLLAIVREHKGLDFAADLGAPVYATGDGVVAMAYFSGSYGNVIFVAHESDYESRYAHLSKFAVGVGEKVKRGQLIGYVGNTGYSVAPHLHYEILYKGQHVNPIHFFQRNLSNEEYQKLIEVGSENVISLD